MLLAVASGRPSPSAAFTEAVVRALLTAYVEVMRGTPVLLQLFVLYYGLASVGAACRRLWRRCSAWASTTRPTRARSTAARSRPYRRGSSRRRARSASHRQTLRLIRGPQAFRYALAPMTNDFVALLKDSSLVSVLTVVELTKQTQIFAANLGSWAVPGALCAAMYLAMSWPLAGWRAGWNGAGRRPRA